MKLTQRLSAIADEVVRGETMADVGTDHGFLPIYLLERGLCPKVIMADVSKGSLAKARANCENSLAEKFTEGEDYELRLGSGLEVLGVGEAHTVVMAGMGGILMTEIMAFDMRKTGSVKRFVLQPRSQIGHLRWWLFDHGYSMSREQLVREGNRICEILTAVPKEIAITRGMGSTDIEYEFPQSVLNIESELLPEYLEQARQKEAFILKAMMSGSEVDAATVRRQEYRVEYIGMLLSRL